MLLIPLLWRLAPALGMVDKPDARKVHQTPVPRVGGIGIVIGALIPVSMFLPFDATLSAYVAGALILLLFGALDDALELGHYTKFVGQFIAVSILIFHGNVLVERVPFLDSNLPYYIAVPFTFFAIVGVINAINHSDGLDGLAGGESLLTLIAVAALAYAYSGNEVLIVALAAIGGILGFLRHNTHPAKVFMGDSGSQFLGFTIAFLVIVLTHNVNVGLSAALPLLLIGLPIADILAVFYLRIKSGNNWFKASRNHIHHRLLDRGFKHYETVVVIYSIQALCVFAAVLFRFEMDILILVLYAAVCVATFSFLTLTERRQWRLDHQRGINRRILAGIERVRDNVVLQRSPLFISAAALSAIVVAGSVWIHEVSRDFGFVGLALLLLLLVEPFIKKRELNVLRIIAYTTITFFVYLTVTAPDDEYPILHRLEQFLFITLAAAIVFSFQFEKGYALKVTPTDYLILFMMITVAVFSGQLFTGALLGELFVKIVVAIYAVEILLTRLPRHWWAVNYASLAALSVLVVRGLF